MAEKHQAKQILHLARDLTTQLQKLIYSKNDI